MRELNHQSNAVNAVRLRDKIAAMFIVGFEGKAVCDDSPIIQQLNEFNLGGVILFDYDLPSKTFNKNIESPAQVRTLNADLQRYNQLFNSRHHRLPLPLLIAVDYEGGAVDRLKSSYGFNETIAANQVAAKSDLEIRQIADTMADTLKQAGFNLNFAPVVDVNVNPNNPILGQLGRCFSENAKEVARIARIYVEAFKNKGIQPAYKHFPGHGSSKTDSHLGFVDVTESWLPIELAPYRTLLAEPGCQMVMTAHIVNRQLDDSGLPATLSYKILTELLRQELQFQGIIITDDMQMKAISDQYGLEESLCLAIQAGADMLIYGNQLVSKPQDLKELIDLVEKNVNEGGIPHERIDEAFSRIVSFKGMVHESH